MKYDRFKMEQYIMDCWNVVEDLNTVFEATYEQNLTKDQMANIHLGLKELYNLKFERLWAEFKKSIKANGV